MTLAHAELKLNLLSMTMFCDCRTCKVLTSMQTQMFLMCMWLCLVPRYVTALTLAINLVNQLRELNDVCTAMYIAKQYNVS